MLNLCPPIVLMVTITVIVSPVLLKLAYKSKPDSIMDLEQSQLQENYPEIRDFKSASQAILNMNDSLQGKPIGGQKKK